VSNVRVGRVEKEFKEKKQTKIENWLKTDVNLMQFDKNTMLYGINFE
jgi:hypothetical protein